MLLQFLQGVKLALNYSITIVALDNYFPRLSVPNTTVSFYSCLEVARDDTPAKIKVNKVTASAVKRVSDDKGSVVKSGVGEQFCHAGVKVLGFNPYKLYTQLLIQLKIG